jgi:hypothetical protein
MKQMQMWRRLPDATRVPKVLTKAVVLDSSGSAGYRVHRDGSVSIWATPRKIKELDRLFSGEDGHRT